MLGEMCEYEEHVDCLDADEWDDDAANPIDEEVAAE
jgi:hypothetical protein